MTARKNSTAKKIVETTTEVVAAATATISYPTTAEMVKAGLATKSARIRHLHALGMPVGDIARQETGGLYQHAYNVIKKPLKGRPAKVVAEVAEEATEVASEATEQVEA